MPINKCLCTNVTPPENTVHISHFTKQWILLLVVCRQTPAYTAFIVYTLTNVYNNKQQRACMFPLSNEIWIVQTHCVASQYFIFKQGYWTEISVWNIDFCCCFFFTLYNLLWLEEEQCHRKCALLIYSHTNTAWTTKVYTSIFKKSFLTVSYAGTPTCIPDTSSYTCKYNRLHISHDKLGASIDL